MSIVSLQKRARRLGEIRLGTTKDGHPVSLQTVRLTSVAKGLLVQAAELWGGKVEAWQPNERSSSRWSLITETSELPVVIPPQDADNISWYEHWGSGGLQRRCDGEQIVNREGDLPCVCDPDNRECNMVTRINLMLPDLPDVGVWLLSSTGWYAATELAMSMQLVIQTMQKTGLLPEATFAIEQREVKRPGEATKKFVVPTLRFADTLSTFLDSAPSLPAGVDDGGGGDGTVHPLPAPVPITPEPETVEQLQEQAREMMDDPEIEEVESMTRLMENKARLEVEAAEAIVYAPDEEPFDTTKPEGDDLAWVSLLTLLEENPDEGIMGVIQDRVRRLYRMMAAVGLWAESARAASLMKHYNEEHLEDLRRPELKQFAEKSFDAARKKVKEAE